MDEIVKTFNNIKNKRNLMKVDLNKRMVNQNKLKHKINKLDKINRQKIKGIKKYMDDNKKYNKELENKNMLKKDVLKPNKNLLKIESKKFDKMDFRKKAKDAV
jgi:hypothetical protein